MLSGRAELALLPSRARTSGGEDSTSFWCAGSDSTASYGDEVQWFVGDIKAHRLLRESDEQIPPTTKQVDLYVSS